MRWMQRSLLLAVLTLPLLATVNCSKEKPREQPRKEEPETGWRTRGQRAESLNNLRQLWTALTLYANDFDGYLPSPQPGIAALATANAYFDDNIHIESLSPGDRVHRRARPGQPLSDEHTSYLYLGAPVVDRPGGYQTETARWPMRTPLIVEKPGLDDESLNVVFLDGHVSVLRGHFTNLTDLMEAIIAAPREDMPAELAAQLREQAKRIDKDRAKYAY